MIKAKFNRGPLNGQRQVVEDVRIRIETMEGPFWHSGVPLEPERRTGEYFKSNRKLKDGSYVYEWMGWFDGKP